ncbi:MAG: quinol:electron acceptor oxidoreductase subunit ActD, partial [Myxococcota bacterium]
MKWQKQETQKPFGILAEFANATALYQACEKVRDAGFRKWDAHTPFPVHGLEKAMGLKASRVPWFSLIGGL